jgi:hypothetical protein
MNVVSRIKSSTDSSSLATPKSARLVEATIQVLPNDGPQRLTTTRVAERGGSVGTLYPYYPNKQAHPN